MRTLLLILCCIGLPALAIGLLSLKVDSEQDRPSGFNRRFGPSPVQLSVLTLDKKDYSIAGFNDSGWYLFDRQRQYLKRLSVDLNRELEIRWPGSKISEFFTGSVQGNTYYEMLPNSRTISVFAFGNGSAQHRILPTPFRQALPISADKVLLRIPIDSGRQVRFALWNGDSLVSERKNISTPIADGGMSTDGMFCRDASTGAAFYVHFYNNQILALDSNLALLFRFTTIDTFAHFVGQVAGKQNKYGVAFTHVQAPRWVNSWASADGGLLHVRSRVKADNEPLSTFKQNAVIDVYQTSTGHYLFSYHLPFIDGEPPIEFAIIGNRILALYLSRVAVFRLPPQA